MKEKIKQAIIERIMKQGQINILIQNLESMNLLNDEKLNKLLDAKEMLEVEIEKLKIELKNY